MPKRKKRRINLRSLEIYPSLQDAAEAAQKLGIKNSGEYKRRCSGDYRLPSNPRLFYKEQGWASWAKFLSNPAIEKKDFYPTWQKAAKAADWLGIEDSVAYAKCYKLDERLPSNLDQFYPSFPGIVAFFGYRRSYVRKKPPSRIFYATWEEAGKAARALGVRTVDEYHSQYKADTRLHSSPNLLYPDFPGFKRFLRRKKIRS